MEQINIVNQNVFLSMIYAHTTRKTDLLYKIFHLNLAFKHLWHPYTFPWLCPWMSKRRHTHIHANTRRPAMLRYQSKMTDVASITFSLYQLFFLGLSYHQKVPVTKKERKGRNWIDDSWNHTGIAGLLQWTLNWKLGRSLEMTLWKNWVYWDRQAVHMEWTKWS